MIKIYHNSRCSKSRCALDLLNSSQKEFEIIEYLKNPPSKTELQQIISKLSIKPIDLVRTKEPIWQENFKHKSLTDDEIIQAMCDYPQLIERPIVIKDDRAIVARDEKKIIDFI